MPCRSLPKDLAPKSLRGGVSLPNSHVHRGCRKWLLFNGIALNTPPSKTRNSRNIMSYFFAILCFLLPYHIIFIEASLPHGDAIRAERSGIDQVKYRKVLQDAGLLNDTRLKYDCCPKST